MIPSYVYLLVYPDSQWASPSGMAHPLLNPAVYSVLAESIRDASATGNATLGDIDYIHRNDVKFSLEGTEYAGQGALVPGTGELYNLPGVPHLWELSAYPTGVGWSLGTGTIWLTDDGVGGKLGRLDVYRSEI